MPRDSEVLTPSLEVRFMCYDLGHYFTDDEFDVAWTLLDADGSGFVEKQEFLNFWRNDDRYGPVLPLACVSSVANSRVCVCACARTDWEDLTS